MLVLPVDPLALSDFVLPVTTKNGKKSLSLQNIWRAPDWRNNVGRIREEIVGCKTLETVEVTDAMDATDLDRFRVFDAVLRHRRVKVVNIHEGQVDPHTLSRLIAMDNIHRLVFYNTTFHDAESIALIIKTNSKRLKYLAFHWRDDGEHEKAIVRSSAVHPSLQKLAAGFLAGCWKVDMELV